MKYCFNKKEADLLHKLSQETGLNKNEIIRLAIHRMTDDYLDYYKADDGPLTEDQLYRIDEVNICKDVPEAEVRNRVF